MTNCRAHLQTLIEKLRAAERELCAVPSDMAYLHVIREALKLAALIAEEPRDSGFGVCEESTRHTGPSRSAPATAEEPSPVARLPEPDTT